MNYKITHSTTYSYSTPVRVCHNHVMLTPREEFPVRCYAHRLLIRPTPQFSAKRKDYFGNTVHSFSIEENHKQLNVTATSRVNIAQRELPEDGQSLPWEEVARAAAFPVDREGVRICQFLFDSPRVERSPEFEEVARKSFEPGRPMLEGVRELTHRIFRHFKYDPAATTVSTAPKASFKLARGVCQDFAHVQLACLRSIGLPARYVSGYLRTVPPPGKERLTGADQSHAWISVYCGPPIGWLDMDPTNNCMCGLDHVPIAWGRDYADVSPFTGVFLGGGEHTLSVSVDVAPQAEGIEDPGAGLG